MDSININNTETTTTSRHSQPTLASYQRHGRTTAVDDHSDLQVLQRIKRYLLPKDFVISQDLLEEMVAGYDIGDPLTDTLAADGIRFAKPLQQLIIDKKTDDNLLKNPSFKTLTEQFSRHPDWFDPKLAQIGAVAYRRYPLMLIWLLRNVALMAGYSIPALSLPLIQTGALMHEALPRLMRTYAYILAVSEHPLLPQSNTSRHSNRKSIDEVLAIGSEGWRQSIKVRQIHTLVRQNLLKGKGNAAAGIIADADQHHNPDGSWNTDYWGLPINQTDMIATHLQFSLLIMRGLRLLGARISSEEAEGILHLWNLASYWMGVDLQRLPKDEAACWEWLYTYLSIQQLDFKMGQPLAKALHDLPRQLMGEDNRRGRFVEMVNASVTRTLVGDDIGDGLDLPKSKIRFGVLSSVPILFALDTARQHNQTIATKLEAFRAKRQDNMNWWLKKNDDYYK
ncbi:oxygenase MpaB family protein [Psychrobacter sp. APC 3426]|uniref:oxygenase MpaB family protein n=1 Tax=Psychrobacter sp. APC 3426 TaxID=3035177 RepID=UPI0025B29A18|nr:oxygenase MpaB family protein [Psychrobacter sp. APC 3426]MDN3398181.1 oxygenase MpaB family protein [Psychrobacter sp. APC 3426]